MRVILLTMIILILGCETKTREDYQRDFSIKVHAEGERAFRLGIPANANPYQGQNGLSYASESWLDGYMDAKEQSTK